MKVSYHIIEEKAISCFFKNSLPKFQFAVPLCGSLDKGRQTMYSVKNGNKCCVESENVTGRCLEFSSIGKGVELSIVHIGIGEI